jgi:hypothetical protein
MVEPTAAVSSFPGASTAIPGDPRFSRNRIDA